MTKSAAALAAAMALAVPASATTVPVPQITIGVPGLPPDFVAVRTYAAIDRGLYAKDLGGAATVSVQPFTDDADALTAVESGQIQLAWVPTPTVLTAIADGAPLVAIEGVDRVDWQLTSTDPSISSCARLKGQTIGVDLDNGPRYDALLAMLATCGLAAADVKTVGYPGGTGMNAQIAGQLTLNVDHADEAAQVRAAGRPLTTVIDLATADPDQHFAMLVTTKDDLTTDGPLFVKLLEGDIAAGRWLAKPPDLVAGANVATITGNSLPVAKSSLRQYLAMGWWSSSTSGLSFQRITRTIGLYTKLGRIPAAAHLTWSEVVDTHLWESASRGA